MLIEFLNKINQFILNPIIILLFALAMLIFFWGIVQFINSETTDSKRGEGKNKIIWGLVGMLIMISSFGIIRLIINTFGLDEPRYPGLLN